MSRHHCEKRAGNQEHRQRDARERPTEPGPDTDTDTDTDRDTDRVRTQQVVLSAVRAAASCACGDVERHVTDLIGAFGAPGGELDVAVGTAALDLVRSVWERGWTPSDVVEVARRRLAAAEVSYLRVAVLVEARHYAQSMLHPRWRTALVAVEAAGGPELGGASGDLRSWAARTGRTRPEALRIVLPALALLVSLPRLPAVLPLPGEHRYETGPVDAVAERMLAKVRALLAKAESTQFRDEAEALSAKAQELMTRYALHHAVRDHDSGRTPAASARRLWLDAPYAGAKAHLVQAVASANRGRTVWFEQLGFVTVVGEGTDLDVVELLTTSLLVQAGRAMLAAGSQVTCSGTSRTRSFRQSFLIAYASRIGERLTVVDDVATTREVSADARLLPALAARSRATEELTGRLFPHVVPRSAAVSNAAGWGAGRAAADLARFDVHDAVAG